ncbi:MAG TPA: class I SAM-dependent methyltransferase [Candidatus Andersenbacteria bacterium]|nr:class I SAM-dependent methyltransferase [Candidatus Andersenbacteria bacterium]
MTARWYTNPEAYDARKLKPLEAYLETLWKPIFSNLAKKYIHDKDVIADFGCGTLAHIRLMNHAAKIYAVDANKTMLEFGMQKLSDTDRLKVVALNESGLHTSIPSSSCSVIWSVGLMEYVDIQQLFAEMTRVAKPGAIMLIQFPNANNIVHIGIRVAHVLQATQAKQYRTTTEIRSVANRYGWFIEESISTGFYIPTPTILIPILSPMWKLFNKFGNNTFLVLRKSTSE